MTLLHSFAGNFVDGAHPRTALVSDGAGRFLGSTYQGGANDLGTIYRVDPAGPTVTVLHAFAGGGTGDGAFPLAALVADGTGGFYGTTESGGMGSWGTVYQFDPAVPSLTVLHAFGSSSLDGRLPSSALVGDSNGGFYGTTSQGGGGGGSIFHLAAETDATLTVSITGAGTVSGPGIACPTDCGEEYPLNTIVGLTATPAPGSLFFTWSGACTGSGACNVTMDTAKSVTATFAVNDQDLVETAVSNPPAAVLPGSAFSVTDTLLNQGGVAAGSSRTRYYLSADTQKNAGDKLLTGNRLVSSVGAGATSTGTVTVTVPNNTVLGIYYLLACADDLTSVSESDETNNCLASATTVEVARADLIETGLSEPPTATTPGGAFSVSETVVNQDATAAGTSTTRYYFSTNGTAKTKRLTGTRSVPSLGPGGTSPGTGVTVTVPNNTVLGTYYLLACADDTTTVTETNEANNCLASATTVQVTRPDLIETGLSNPPAAATRGSAFSVSETVVNQGVVTASASTTRYYVSVDGVAKTKRLNGTRAVGSLGARSVVNRGGDPGHGTEQHGARDVLPPRMCGRHDQRDGDGRDATTVCLRPRRSW